MKKLSISFRKLDYADAANYRAIRLECLKAYPENFGSTFEDQRKLPKLMFEQALEHPVEDRFVMGAFVQTSLDQKGLDQKRLIGICGFVPVIADGVQTLALLGVIIQVYVQAAYSGNRIGLGLIQATVSEGFKSTAVDKIKLEVKANNTRAIRVYEQAGFQAYTPTKADRDENTIYMVVYRDQF